MAFDNYTAYVNSLELQNSADYVMSGTNPTVTAGRFFNLSGLFVPAPTAPTTSTTLTKSSLYSINSRVANAGDGRLSILGSQSSSNVQAGSMLMLVDILNMSGGLSGTSISTQTVNTAALTRYTDGIGVQAAIIIHTAVGATAATVTARYTNENNTSSRLTTAVVIGGTGFNSANQLIRLPLQDNDRGIKSVESIQINTSTLTAGNIGVVLYKPLAMIIDGNMETNTIVDCVSSGRMVGQLNEVLDDACLSVFSVYPVIQSTSANIFLGEA
jgi:hypothetical protein